MTINCHKSRGVCIPLNTLPSENAGIAKIALTFLFFAGTMVIIARCGCFLLLPVNMK